MPIEFDPPTTKDLADLKTQLKATGREMAEIFWLGGDHQWRKYTGGQHPREMSPQMAFLGAAVMELTDDEFNRVLRRMETFGARVRPAPDGDPQP